MHVRVLDKNDVAPTWDSGPWKFNISEEAPPNTVITILRAHDPDTIGSLTYILVPNHHPGLNDRPESVDDDYGTESQFKLNPTTGQLSLAEALDRETKEKYLLKVRADDGRQHRDIVLTVQVSRILSVKNVLFPFRRDLDLILLFLVITAKLIMK